MSQDKHVKLAQTDNAQRIPIIEPLLLILKSRKGMAFLVSFIALTLPVWTPVTADMAFQMAVGSWVYIGGQSLVDAQNAAKTSKDELREQVRKLVLDKLEEPTYRS